MKYREAKLKSGLAGLPAPRMRRWLGAQESSVSARLSMRQWSVVGLNGLADSALVRVRNAGSMRRLAERGGVGVAPRTLGLSSSAESPRRCGVRQQGEFVCPGLTEC